MLKNPVLLARIGAPHGVRGEVRVKSFTEEPLSFYDYGPLHTADGRQFEVVAARMAKTMAIVRFDGVYTREAAEVLNGTELYTERSRLPEVQEEDEYYASDLAGLTVLDQGGGQFGKVRALYDFGAGDIVEIDLFEGGQELFAFTKEIFPEIDLAAGTIVIVPPNLVSERDGIEQEK
ncbi:MAG: ribosome maturation factor RimM [Rhizobiaceae bacterium]